MTPSRLLSSISDADLRTMSKQTTVILVSAILFSLVGCSSTDVGSVPRQIAVSEADLENIRTIRGQAANGVYVTMSTREYTGQQMGFWGAETSPPFDILWSLSIESEGGQIQIPSSYLRDLAGFLRSPSTKTVESYVSINPNRLSISRQDDRYQIHLEAGDGADTYAVDFDVAVDESGAVNVKRTVRYHMGGHGEIWAP